MGRWEPVTRVEYRSDWLEAEPTDRREARSRGWSVHEWRDGPGGFHPEHDHEYGHRVVVLEGTMEFSVDGENFELEPGDALDLPARVNHEAASDENQGARYWQLQSPE